MLAVLLAGSTWMLLASFLGMPVSITNAIVGSLVGFGVLIFGVDAIHWEQVGYIAISWVSSPLIASIIAYHLLRSVQRLIFETTEPAYYARRYFPLYLFIIGIVLSNMVVLKGLHHFHYDWGQNTLLIITIVCGIITSIVGMIFILRIPQHIPIDTRSQFNYVEKAFRVLVAFTTCAIVFAHGSNDVAIAVGPISAIFDITQGNFFQEGQTPSWIVCFATAGVIIGLMMYGRKVITTVGSNITALTPSRAFAATLSAATTVIVSTGTGIPVSATQTLVGAILGVGLARGVGALNLVAIRNIFMSWLVTLPAASLLTVGYFFLFSYIFKN
jgi:PiT family inorganic phosphate transporter